MINIVSNYTNHSRAEVKLKGVYLITFLHAPDKVYVGSTFSKKGFYHRWYQHIHCLRKNKHHCKHLQSIVNKHGLSNLLFTILEVIDDKALSYQKEKEYIDIYKSSHKLVNTVEEAYSMRNYIPSKEIKDKLSAKMKGKRTYDNRKAVYQYSINGDLIQKWESFKYLSESYSRGRNYFYFKGDFKCFSDFILVKNPDNTDIKCIECNGAYTTQKKKVNQYTIDGTFVKSWNCGRDAEKFLDVKKGAISQAVSGDIKILKGFIWKRD